MAILQNIFKNMRKKQEVIAANNESSLYLVIIGLILIIISLKLFSLFPDIKYHPRADEGYYLNYMDYINRNGFAGFRELIYSYINDNRQWMFPNPLRIGFIAVSAVWAGMFGVSFTSLSFLSMLSFLLFVALNYSFVKRYFGNPHALFVAALLGFSPLLLGLSLHALMESFTLLINSLTVWLFLYAASKPHQVKNWLGFMASFYASLVTKETSILLLLPFVVFLLIERYFQKNNRYLLYLALPPFLCGLTYLFIAGGLEPVLRLAHIMLSSPATNPYAIQFGSGPWYRYIIDFISLSPLTTLLAIAYAGILLSRFKSGDYDRNAFFFLILCGSLLAEYSILTKSVRYVCILEIPCKLFAVLMLRDTFRLQENRINVICALFVAVFCFIDYQTFDWMFVKNALYDPSSYSLLRLRAMIPM